MKRMLSLMLALLTMLTTLTALPALAEEAAWKQQLPAEIADLFAVPVQPEGGWDTLFPNG